MTKYSFQELAWSVGVPKVAREVLLQVPELIAKAVDEEREACAKTCEAQRNMIVKSHPTCIEFDPNDFMAKKCAAVIRARGENK